MAVNSLKLTICSADILILNPSNGIWSTALETCFEQQIWNISPCASIGSKVLTKSLTNYPWETNTVEMDPNYLDLYRIHFMDFLLHINKDNCTNSMFHRFSLLLINIFTFNCFQIFSFYICKRYVSDKVVFVVSNVFHLFVSLLVFNQISL